MQSIDPVLGHGRLPRRLVALLIAPARMTQTTESIHRTGASIARSVPLTPGPSPATGRGEKSSLREGYSLATDRQPLPTEAGSWRLEGLLGEGTLARVFAARPISSADDRPAAYALKMLRPKWENRPEALDLIRREALVGRAIAHPHLIAVLAAQLHGPPYFIIMPRLAGQTLAARLEREKSLPLPIALWIARQTAEALGALHRHGHLHGDVKPANTWLAPTGHVTLLDLSFARPFDQSGSAADRPILGTVNYLAPEQITSALRADARSDIYSLGAMLFEMLAGQLPLEIRDLADLLRVHRQRRAKNLRALRPDVPPTLADLVRRMLAAEPLRRPQTIDEVIHRLTKLEIETLAERIGAG